MFRKQDQKNPEKSKEIDKNSKLHVSKCSMSIGRRSPELLPAFFKVYTPKLCSSRLRIPVAFELHIKGKFPQTAIFKCRGEKTWKVEIKGDENGFFFNNGWSRFVQENGVKLGEFLFFYYDKSSSGFTVKIFDRSLCEKKRRTKELKGICSHKEASVKLEINPSDDEGIGGIRDHESVPLKRDHESLPLKRAKKENEDGVAVDEYVPEGPWFRVTLTPSYAGKASFLDVPYKFYEAHLKDKSRVEPRVCGKPWEVFLCTPRPNASWFRRGWRLFIKGNGLQVGDVCVFELVDDVNAAFKVSFFR